MNIEKSVADSLNYLNNYGFTTPESEIASYLEKTFKNADPVEIYATICRSFPRASADAFFTYTSFLWQQLSSKMIVELLVRAGPRPQPTWGWDGGEFADITFISRTLRLNVFMVATGASLDAESTSRILEFGSFNAEVLTSSSGDEDDEDDDDHYYEVFLKRKNMLRQALLAEQPSLDIEAWSMTQLEESILALKRQANLPSQ